MKRPLPVLIVGGLGWLAFVGGLWLLFIKAQGLISGDQTVAAWAVLAHMVIIGAYMACVVGFWWMRKWSVHLFAITTAVMAPIDLAAGIFEWRNYTIPVLVIIVGYAFLPRLRR
ncbi:MAG: hypothetical protein ACPGU7_01450 [Gammaproteobacteria bacterium]